MGARSSKRFRTCDTVYDNDRWRVPGHREIYIAHYRNVNGVPFWELYYAATPKSEPKYVFGGLETYFGAKLKEFYNRNSLKKIRTRRADRIGPCVSLWGLTH